MCVPLEAGSLTEFRDRSLAKLAGQRTLLSLLTPVLRFKKRYHTTLLSFARVPQLDLRVPVLVVGEQLY